MQVIRECEQIIMIHWLPAVFTSGLESTLQKYNILPSQNIKIKTDKEQNWMVLLNELIWEHYFKRKGL